jgi:hypothetical protein
VKPVSLAQAPTDVDNVGSARFEKDRVLHRAVDEVYFRVEIPAGEGVINGGPGALDTTNFAFEDWPAAVVTGRRRVRRMRSLWPKVRTRMNLWYTSDVGSTNNFSVRFNIRQLATGMLLTAPALLFSTTFNAPGPAVANTVLFITQVDATPWLPAPELCEFSVLRIGPDANANAFRFILAEFVLEEVA